MNTHPSNLCPAAVIAAILRCTAPGPRAPTPSCAIDMLFLSAWAGRGASCDGPPGGCPTNASYSLVEVSLGQCFVAVRVVESRPALFLVAFPTVDRQIEAQQIACTHVLLGRLLEHTAEQCQVRLVA